MGIWIAKINKVSIAGGGDKTAVMITAGTNHQVELLEVAVFCFGTNATQAPIEFQLVRATTAGTASALTAVKWNDSDGDAADATLQDTFTVEPTTGTILLPFAVHPQTGIILPMVEPLIIGAGDRLTLLVKNPVTATSINGYLKYKE